MIYWRCECGKAEMWESGMSPSDCQGCEQCGTTFATSKTGHKQLKPHEWAPRYNKNTGHPDGMECTRCYRREKDRPHTPKPTKSTDFTKVKRILDL